MAFLKLPDKDAEECLDYVVNFQELQAELVDLATSGHAVVVESMTPNESPVTLTFPVSPEAQAVAVQSPAESPQFLNSLQFYLLGGTEGTKYTLKLTATDESLGHARIFVRRATVKIKKR